MSAWLSFLGGYAKGANEEIDKQREKEEQYIQDRMKMAAATRLQKEKEAETQRKELMEAKGTLQAYPGFANANPAQQIALLADPTIREKFIAKSKNGEVFDIDKELDIKYERLKQYKTVDDYVQSVRAKPKAVDTQTMAAFNTPKRVFGAVVGTDAEGLKQNAARFNMTPEEFGGWSQGGEEVTPETGFASFKQEALAPTDIDGQLKLIESRGLRLIEEMKDPTKSEASKAEFAKLQTKIIGLNTFKKMIEGGEEAINLQRKLDGIVWELATTKDPVRKKELSALKIQIENAKDLGTRKPEGAGTEKVSFATMFRGGDSAGTRNVMAKFGNLAAKGQLVIIPPSTPEGQSTIKFDKTDPKVQQQVREAYNEGAMSVFEPMLKDGRPLNDNMRIAMQSLGLPVVSGAAPVVTPPPKPEPAVTPPTKPAAGGTTGPKPISMREIVDIEEYQKQTLPPDKRKTAAQLVDMYTRARDAKGNPQYKVVP